MAELEKHEQLVLPEFIIDDAISADRRTALEGLQRVIHSDPDTAQQSLDVYFQSPEATSQVIAFLHQHPEGGLNVLQDVKTVIDTKADIEVSFDQETEAAIEADTVYKSGISRFRETAREEDRTWFRRRRLHIAINRVRSSRETAA